MRPTQDDCQSISVSRLRALGAVTGDMASVRVTIGEVSREVSLWHMRFPNGGGWSFFLCPSCGRRARVLKLFEKIACWGCTRLEGKPLPYRVQLGDKSQRIERLRQKLNGGAARLRPRPGRTLDRRRWLERALRLALIAERKEKLKGWPPPKKTRRSLRRSKAKGCSIEATELALDQPSHGRGDIGSVEPVGYVSRVRSKCKDEVCRRQSQFPQGTVFGQIAGIKSRS
jgi:hypothetical protein